MPKTSPGLFIGWRLESGLRYRGVLFVADYERVRKGEFDWKRVVAVHEREVYNPPELTFPFAEARRAALKSLGPPDAVLPSLAQMPLPFAEEAGEGDPPPVPDIGPEKIVPKFRITLNRLCEHGMTPGCDGCQFLGTDAPKPRTDECRARFAELLNKTQSVVTSITADVEAAEPADTGGAAGSAQGGEVAKAILASDPPQEGEAACGPQWLFPEEGDGAGEPTMPDAFGAAARPAKHPKGKKVTFNMSDYVRQAVAGRGMQWQASGRHLCIK